MPRVKLAHWHGGNPPGAEISVSDQELAALRRDGRVAEVLAPTSEQQGPAAEPEPSPEAAPDVPAPRARKR
ncbi:hypothetical protein [Streptomyces sp. GbtcB6]|uniref:hypothetical protein n=1 Tax=Streptomyces sp. GbtcB6 TaxID=2824751 RepID=UPI001C2F956D|nr:hypothetical protein [Streptomyces sp. GbtcB6]